MYASEQNSGIAIRTMGLRMPSLQRKTPMNANQVNGSVRALAGKLQEQAGILLGSRAQQLRGLQKQVLGQAEKKLGDYQECAKQAVSGL
jgi:uncharacterized protein YjbJ (UPF0337 family)